MRRAGRSLLAAALAMVLVAVVVGCSDEQSEFCDRLRDRYDLADLRRALDEGDDAAIEAALADLEDLASRAPAEISDDVRAVVDAVVDSVRAATGVTGPDGDTMPVDLARLDAALAEVSDHSRAVVAYGQQECELPRTSTP